MLYFGRLKDIAPPLYIKISNYRESQETDKIILFSYKHLYRPLRKIHTIFNCHKQLQIYTAKTFLYVLCIFQLLIKLFVTVKCFKSVSLKNMNLICLLAFPIIVFEYYILFFEVKITFCFKYTLDLKLMRTQIFIIIIPKNFLSLSHVYIDIYVPVS